MVLFFSGGVLIGFVFSGGVYISRVYNDFVVAHSTFISLLLIMYAHKN